MSLKIIIEREFDNQLLSRKQINFKIVHQNKATPTRIEVRKKVAAQFNADLERVIISKLIPKFGSQLTIGYAKIYDTVEMAQKIEPKHILKRNQPKEKKAVKG
ncbi:MAG: 30S ribosomal protein S24e [Promethearchaeota archaeon]